MEALVLSSGGLDSTVCLALAVEKYGPANVLSLSISYGQKHDKELLASANVAAFYGVKHLSLDLGEIFKDSQSSLIQGASEEIPEEAYAEQLKTTAGAPVSTYVPFRNGLFLSSAAALAQSHGCKVVYYGAHADDAAGNAYPDTSVAFHQAMAESIYLGTGKDLTIVAPFIAKTKADVVAEGIRLGVPFALTWSCYNGREKACGVCGTCRDRLAAFQKNGIQDPIEYEKLVQ